MASAYVFLMITAVLTFKSIRFEDYFDAYFDALVNTADMKIWHQGSFFQHFSDEKIYALCTVRLAKCRGKTRFCGF